MLDAEGRWPAGGNCHTSPGSMIGMGRPPLVIGRHPMSREFQPSTII